MIQLIFEFLGDMELVIVDKNNLLFGNTHFGSKLAPIDNLKLDYEGVVREFPDLELENEWREIAIKRFKQKIKDFPTERDVALYVVDELKKFGHTPIKIQMQGSRWKKIDGNG